MKRLATGTSKPEHGTIAANISNNCFLAQYHGREAHFHVHASMRCTMKNIVTFVKTTVIGGLIVIVPLAIIAFVVGDAVNSLVTTAKPLTQDLPFGALTNTLLALVLVTAFIIAVCFSAGFLLSTLWGAAIKNWLEVNLFERIPMYTTLRGLTQKFAGIEGADFPVVEADLYNSDGRVLGVVVDSLPDERQVVYIPSSPVVTVGQLHILPKTRITETDLSMSETIGCLSQMGIETGKLYEQPLR